MKEITLNYDIMMECIRELNNLRFECGKMECPESSGSGMADEGIRETAQIYGQLSASLESLIEETVRYLSQMVLDFKETDERMAKAMKKGVKL